MAEKIIDNGISAYSISRGSRSARGVRGNTCHPTKAVTGPDVAHPIRSPRTTSRLLAPDELCIPVLYHPGSSWRFAREQDDTDTSDANRCADDIPPIGRTLPETA